MMTIRGLSDGYRMTIRGILVQLSPPPFSPSFPFSTIFSLLHLYHRFCDFLHVKNTFFCLQRRLLPPPTTPSSASNHNFFRLQPHLLPPPTTPSSASNQSSSYCL
uniref:Uncharacterized protein n=1 Tax=Cucumis melo TaxID=3656 RepID=A0A9I9E5E2_CUCME